MKDQTVENRRRQMTTDYWRGICAIVVEHRAARTLEELTTAMNFKQMESSTFRREERAEVTPGP